MKTENLDDTYNGWTNYETWNVALWINNEEFLYNLAKRSIDYRRFREALKDLYFDMEISTKTPDGVNWNDKELNLEELDAMFDEEF